MLKIILSFGLFGDYNKIREMTLKTKLFYPLYKLYEAFHGSFLPLTKYYKRKDSVSTRSKRMLLFNNMHYWYWLYHNATCYNWFKLC